MFLKVLVSRITISYIQFLIEEVAPMVIVLFCCITVHPANIEAVNEFIDFDAAKSTQMFFPMEYCTLYPCLLLGCWVQVRVVHNEGVE